MSDELQEIAHALGEVYFMRKEAEDEQKLLREEFFDAITESFEGEDLARKTVAIPEDIINATEWAEKYNPGWRVVMIQSEQVILEEDPAFKSSMIVVRTDPFEVSAPTKKKPDRVKTVYGYVVTKTIRSGTTLIDADRMREVDADLYNQVTTLPPWWEGIKEFVTGDPAKVFAALGEYRVLRDNLTDKEIAAIKPYVYEGPKTKALNVSYAAEDEQAEG